MARDLDASEQLRAWLARRQFTVAQAASFLGCHRSTLYTWLNGSKSPSRPWRQILLKKTRGEVGRDRRDAMNAPGR